MTGRPCPTDWRLPCSSVRCHRKAATASGSTRPRAMPRWPAIASNLPRTARDGSVFAWAWRPRRAAPSACPDQVKAAGAFGSAAPWASASLATPLRPIRRYTVMLPLPLR
ncbi:MAG: CxxxxCH/CxxCH domain-containing protein [Sulfuritalea sp.]|nr:CxxxxCH/CxxCH domain-containing protein [Sulfuritalea sp.]